MRIIKNTKYQAIRLAANIISSGITAVFDLDGVLLNASQRHNVYTAQDVKKGVCTFEQIGALNLPLYRVNSTAEKIALDQPMALLETIHVLNEQRIKYHVATARVACQHTRKLLKVNGIRPTLIMARQGEQDQRRDYDLKTDHLVRNFDQRQRENMVLIDDNLANCKAVIEIGLKAIHVPFKGH